MLELSDCTFFGHALPEPFVKLELEGRLAKEGLLPKATGAEGRRLDEEWETYRRALRSLGSSGGPTHVVSHVIRPLREPFGYLALEREEPVETREGEEDGGWLLNGTPGGAHLRAFAFDLGADLDAPARRGHAYRFSPGRIAHRVLLARNEHAALLTNGVQLRLLLCDPARPESHIAFRLDRGSRGWAGRPSVPDSFRLLRSLASPAGLALLPDLTEAARLNQVTVTKNLRKQARAAVEGFVQEVLDHPENSAALASRGGPGLAKDLWREGLVLIYRLLFTLKLEASADPARAFSFASTSLWRRTFSPNAALGPVARSVLSEGADTGSLLEDGLRTLFRLFAKGVSSSELRISPLGGALFGEGTTPLLDSFRWGERAVARLLVNLLWTAGKEGEQRVHYGTLDVEDLGRVYESLLELEPGIAAEPMCRLRRQKLESVVPLAQGERYRKTDRFVANADGAAETEDDAGEDEDDAPKEKESKVVRDGKEIATGEFFLRVGLGRKSTGAYYTPHPFVRFLVQETLGPQAAERSPAHEPDPCGLLSLSILDPAMGSGHFLVEACRFLGEKVYEACRLCDELALAVEEVAGRATNPEERAKHEARAAELRGRVESLPDPDDLMVAYLPSRVAEGESAGLSQTKALALARRLVAVHCLYGVDKNPLAVELAKLALWLESYAEGLPLTFLDHRLICGDSLTGPFFENLLTYPGSGQPVGGLFAEGLTDRLKATLQDALAHVRDLEASVGKDVSDLAAKQRAKERLDTALAPFRPLAAAWSGGVMFGRDSCDDAAYEALLRAVAEKRDPGTLLAASLPLAAMAEAGREGVPYDLAFPEVFHPDGTSVRRGFDAVLGNPPWEKPHLEPKIFFGAVAPDILDSLHGSDWNSRVESILANDAAVAAQWKQHGESQRRLREFVSRYCGLASLWTGREQRGHSDLFMAFMVRGTELLVNGGEFGQVLAGGLAKNPAALPLRSLVWLLKRPRVFLHFDNANALFPELPRILEFCVVAYRNRAWAEGDGTAFAGIGLRSFEDLDPEKWVRVSLATAEKARNSQLTLDRLTEKALEVAAPSLWEFIQGASGRLYQEVNTSSDPDVQPVSPSSQDEPTSPDAPHSGIRLLNARSIRQYDDAPTSRRGRWSPEPTVTLCIRSRHSLSVADKARYFRLSMKRQVGSPKSNERTLVAALVSPGTACAESLLVESDPTKRTNAAALVAVGCLNSYVPDGMIRPRVQTKIGIAQLRDARGPAGTWPDRTSELLVAHSALRLTCNHAGYAPIWREQVGEAWREPKPSSTWPVLEGDDARWVVRAAIDAVVADAYGLSRDQYAHVLSTFSHKSYPKAPGLCLAAFDELKKIGIEAFTRRHDPYYDIPLNEDLPKPIIDIPMPSGTPGQLDLGLGGPEDAARPRKRKKG